MKLVIIDKAHRIRNYEQIDKHVGFYHVFNTPRTDELRAILEALGN